MVLDHLDAVTIGIVDERDRHRPTVETGGFHRGLESGGDGLRVGGVAVVDPHVDLPQREPVVDRLPALMPLGQLQPATALVGREVRLVHVVDLGPALHLQADDLGVEADRALDVAHVDAVLADRRWHGGTPWWTGSDDQAGATSDASRIRVLR